MITLSSDVGIVPVVKIAWQKNDTPQKFVGNGYKLETNIFFNEVTSFPNHHVYPFLVFILMYITQVPFQNHLQSLQLFSEVPNLHRRFTAPPKKKRKDKKRLCAAAATTRSNSTSSLKFSLWEFKGPHPKCQGRDAKIGEPLKF